MIQGIDISHYQGTPNWKQVAKAGVKFVICKASQGATFVDHNVEANVKGAKAAGLFVGLYHYFLPTGDAGAQFANFWAVLKNCGGPSGLLVPVIDVEGDIHNLLGGMTATKYADSALAWLSYLEKKTGRKGIVYTYSSFADQLEGKLGGYPLWCAAYPELILECGRLEQFPSWENWTFWQWSDKGEVPGITGKVDLDVFNGTEEDLKRMVI